MAKDKITEYDATASNNTVVGDVNLAENSALPSDMNNAIREVMSHQKEAFGSGTPLFVDQTNNRVGVNKTPTVALDVSGQAIITTTDNSSTLTLTSTDADASSGPNMVLKRDSASPADNDTVGRVKFVFDNDAGEETEAVRIDAFIPDVSDGTEDATFQELTMVGGTMRSRVEHSSTETVFNQENIDLDFRVEAVGFNNGILLQGSDGNLFFGKSSTSASVQGVQFRHGISNGNSITQNSTTVLRINRQSNDGDLIQFLQANNQEGSISVSGGAVSYNTFSGSHWSRLSDNSKPTILVGTVIETIDEMCDWYQAEFTMEEATEDTQEVKEKISIGLPKGKSVGDKISITHEGITYKDATILKENDDKHPKCKISDTAESKRVYGVHSAWDNDDDAVNDMYVTAVGTHVVRINKDITVSAGDLLVSNGDGTAKVQDDDIIRSKTIGKVLTNIKQETYDDGSYTVPCALYCG